jgi:hypothetical protein
VPCKGSVQKASVKGNLSIEIRQLQNLWDLTLMV